MKVLTILGARPQFIKAGTVSREIEKQKLEGKDIEEIIVHTGQHYDSNMSDVFFEQMKIPKPNYFLGVGGKSHGAMTGQMMEKIERIALIEKPDWIMVYGDTNSTLAGSLVASKLHIKLAHIEAGLRSFNMKMPEEVNRILTDRVSDILFCPTETAIKNLKNESFPFKVTLNNQQRIINVGDVMQDGALFYKDLAVRPNFNDKSINTNSYILCTIHRAENTDNIERLREIIEALNVISDEINIILPLHPRTKKIIIENSISIDFTIIEPVGYLEMVWLIDNCTIVMTDSGGLQKEAYFFRKPCITLRDETEWVELVENGYNTLVGSSKKAILESLKKVQNMNKNYNENLFGDGHASKKIVKELLK